MIPYSELVDHFSHIESLAAAAGRKAFTVTEYSPYANLRDGLRKAIAALDDIAALPPAIRERMEGGAL